MLKVDYKKQGTDFLAKHEIAFAVTFVGYDCPMFCDDATAERGMQDVNTFPRRTHIHGYHYRATFKRSEGKQVSFDYWNSYHDEERNWTITHRFQAHHTLTQKHKGIERAEVDAYSIISCLTKDDPGAFDEFCMNFGYETDSRRAEQTYIAVLAEWRKVQKFFTQDEIAEMQNIN